MVYDNLYSPCTTVHLLLLLLILLLLQDNVRTNT